MLENKLPLLTTAALLAMGLTAPNADAELLIYEPFDYSDSDLSANTQAGLGLSGDWTDSGTTVATPGLTFGSLTTAGGKALSDDDYAAASVGTTLVGHLDDGDTLWFSFLISTIEKGSNPDFGFALATDRGNDVNNIPLVNSGNGIGVRIKDSQIRAAAWTNGSPDTVAGTGFGADITYLLVGEIIFGETDTINIYRPDTDLNLGSVISTTSGTFDQSQFDTITFVNKNTTNPGDGVDEIRFGTTSDDVLSIPEPGSLALLGLGGLLACNRRRR